MSRSQNEGICLSPVFTPHRVDVVAADDADLSKINKADGMDTKGYDDVIADVTIAGTGSVTVDVLYWSDDANSFIPASPAVTFTLTASAMVRCNSYSRRIFTRISGADVGAEGKVSRVDVSCAANLLRNI